jgi:hypothetical protein
MEALIPMLSAYQKNWQAYRQTHMVIDEGGSIFVVAAWAGRGMLPRSQGFDAVQYATIGKP